MSADKKPEEITPKLKIIKSVPPEHKQGLQPKSQIAREMSDFATRLQQQTDAIMRMWADLAT